MNKSHLIYLASPAWAQALRADLLPWLETVADLGDDVLEVGPGPGLTTDLLRERVTAVTAVEIDPTLAAALTVRLAGTNVEVIQGDAGTTDLSDDRFSAATCFSMLHHIPTRQEQDRLFREIHRVLRPDGVLVAVDSLDTEPIRQAHIDDVFVPLDAETLGTRLEQAGFCDITIVRAGEFPIRGDQIRFTARKPSL